MCLPSTFVSLLFSSSITPRFKKNSFNLYRLSFFISSITSASTSLRIFCIFLSNSLATFGSLFLTHRTCLMLCCVIISNVSSSASSNAAVYSAHSASFIPLLSCVSNIAFKSYICCACTICSSVANIRPMTFLISFVRIGRSFPVSRLYNSFSFVLTSSYTLLIKLLNLLNNLTMPLSIFGDLPSNKYFSKLYANAS